MLVIKNFTLLVSIFCLWFLFVDTENNPFSCRLIISSSIKEGNVSFLAISSVNSIDSNTCFTLELCFFWLNCFYSFSLFTLMHDDGPTHDHYWLMIEVSISVCVCLCIEREWDYLCLLNIDMESLKASFDCEYLRLSVCLSIYHWTVLTDWVVNDVEWCVSVCADQWSLAVITLNQTVKRLCTLTSSKVDLR